MNWLFDGLGTALVTTLLGIGVASGCFVIYRQKTKKRKNIRQNQKAGANATQIQIGGDYHGR
jgi:biopolymer transport protein ExbB/TolQ